MSDTADILVRYVRNADDNHGTASIKFNDDDRPDLEIGLTGYVTQTELHRLGAYGIILEPITEDEAENLGIAPVVTEEVEIVSADLGRDRLKEIAEEEGVDLTGKTTNEAKAEAILDARSNTDVGAASLPATATAGLTAPAPDGL